MKKFSIYSIASAFLAGIVLVGCSSAEDEFSTNGNDNGPKLKIETRGGSAVEANYAHKAVLVSEGNIADAKSGANAAALEAFSVEPGSYTVYASAANDEANLTFSGISASNAIASSRIKISDMSAQIPELLVGKSNAVTVGADGATANLELKRVVASVSVTVNGLESVDASSITLTINNMYDQVDFEGNPLKSGAEFLSKTITLTKNAAGKFVGNAIIMPTDAEATKLSLAYTVNGTTYNSTPAGKLQSNGQYELNTTVETSTTRVNLSSVLSYAAWDSTVVSLSDSFTIGGDAPEKQWVGPIALLIGGTDNGRNNFWASSDAGDSGWGETYWAYNLYDSNKADGSNYWTPAEWDRIAPIWYLDLGAAKQGVTIDYWNKAGGKGGQKIKTMDIYASNDAADYGGGNSNWVKLTTFTSDKTTPSIDAGAQVTTSQIKFSADGATSYRYVKCVITSKVDSNGTANTETIDVNVGELEVYTWTFE